MPAILTGNKGLDIVDEREAAAGSLISNQSGDGGKARPGRDFAASGQYDRGSCGFKNLLFDAVERE